MTVSFLKGVIGTIIPKRRIGDLVANVTVEEDHDDELIVTDHPVQQGATISDHAFKRPAELTLRVGWSNSTTEAGGDEDYVRQIYAQLLLLQETRTLIDIVTGKRSYSNMLIMGLGTRTDQRTETTLMIVARCRQIIFTTTQVVTVPPPQDQANPAKTGATQQLGTKQVQPAPNYNPVPPPPAVVMEPLTP